MAHRRHSARWKAPGRINLIGEHTDYNDGFALPFAIDAGCIASVTVLEQPRIRARSLQRDTEVSVGLDELIPGAGDWAGYVLGVGWVLRRMGHRIPGLAIEIDSTVPVGSGLSSSAALVCSTAAAVNDVLGLGLEDAELLAVTRSVENDFVGAPTGGMDQLASLRCEREHALFCDMRSLHTEQVPLRLGASDLAVLVIDTRAEHRHADGEYASRRNGCREAARLLGVPALRDVPIEELADALQRLDDDTLRRYTRHVVSENHRVLQTVEQLRATGPGTIGELMSASHASMRDDYRITVPEVDVAAEALLAAGARGARMTGGGFGGCVIALLDAPLVDPAVELVRRRYAEHRFATPNHFVVEHASPGAQPLTTRRGSGTA